MGSSGSGSGFGSGYRYLDPHCVIELLIRRMPRQLLSYLDSIPATSRDFHCHQVIRVGWTLLDLVSRPGRYSLHEENRRILIWAEMAWFHLTNSRFCAPRMFGKPSNITSIAGHYTHPHNSSSYSGKLRHAAVHNQSSASNTRIHGATFPPLRASSSDVNSFPTRRARVLDETSDFNSGTHASTYASLEGPHMHPLNSSSYCRRMLNRGPDSNELIHSAGSSSRTPAAKLIPLQETFDDVHRHAAMHDLLSTSNSRIHAAMLPPSARLLEELSASNSGKRPVSEVKQIKAKILRLNVASVIRTVRLKNAAGVLIRDGTMAPFVTASCFRQLLYTDPALLFATACCEGIRMALLHEPTTIVLESHLVPLLERLVATQSQAGEVFYSWTNCWAQI